MSQPHWVFLSYNLPCFPLLFVADITLGIWLYGFPQLWGRNELQTSGVSCLAPPLHVSVHDPVSCCPSPKHSLLFHLFSSPVLCLFFPGPSCLKARLVWRTGFPRRPRQPALTCTLSTPSPTCPSRRTKQRFATSSRSLRPSRSRLSRKPRWIWPIHSWSNWSNLLMLLF